MKTLGFQTADELGEYLSTLGNGYLFRGQLKDYLDGEGRPTLSTSFSRKGCLPPLMLKWFYYSKLVLRQFVKGFDDQPDLAVDQAILQHYGWRSFFIDATSSPEVACWFAAHKYTSDFNLNLTKDCWEDPAWLVHEWAQYVDHDGTGVLYAISRKALRGKTIQSVSLDEIITKHATARYAVQSAWLIGPLDEALPHECIAIRIYAPTSVFKEVARKSGLGEQSNLFPTPKDDPILRSLLGLPFINRRFHDDPPPLKVFDRSLPIPEYGWKPVKRHPGTTAFYFPFWLANEPKRMPFPDCASFLLCDETSYFGQDAYSELNFPYLTKILRRFGSVAVETDNVIYYPGENHFGGYGKGVYLKRDGETVWVHEIILKQGGMRPARVGLAKGWRYRINGEMWERQEDPDDCPCANEALHLRHLTFLAHVESHWSEGQFFKAREGVYCFKGLDPTMDLSDVECEYSDESAA